MTIEEIAAKLSKAIYPHFTDDRNAEKVNALLIAFADEIIRLSREY
jgi:hypothetical protein